MSYFDTIIFFLKKHAPTLLSYVSALPRAHIALICAVVIIAGVLAAQVFASEDHGDEASGTPALTEQLTVRTVGDTDPDNISAEGLVSFYGEVISNDIGSIHSSREGVITSWSASVGQYVSAGDVLGHVTVTGVSPEQQMLLAQQQANIIKAELDLETAQSIASSTEDALRKNQDAFKDITAKQRAFYDGTGTAATTYQTELAAIFAKYTLFAGKLQDFAKTSLVDVYSRISGSGTSIDSANFIVYAQVKNGVGVYSSSERNAYLAFLGVYTQKVKARSVTQEDVQEFLNKTISILSNSSEADGFTRTDLENTIALVRDFQTDFRDLSDTLSQVTIDKASKERERGQLDIELAKSSSALETELRLKQLDLSSASTRAKNEARAAQLLAQRLSVSAGGVVPIFASRSGIVASVEKNVGTYVAVSDTIGHISTKNPERRVRFTVPPSWKEIKRGDSLSTVWRSEYAPSVATVTGVSPMISDKGGYQAEALLASDAVYPLGASVTLVPERSKKGAFIHRKSVVFDKAAPYIWTLDVKEMLQKTNVTVGRQLGEYVEILSDIPRGTEYLVLFDTTLKLEAGKLVTDYITTPTPEEHAGEEEEGEEDGHNHEE